MFEASYSGCLLCVKHCIEEQGVDKESESEHKKFKVLGWAKFAVGHNVVGTSPQ